MIPRLQCRVRIRSRSCVRVSIRPLDAAGCVPYRAWTYFPLICPFPGNPAASFPGRKVCYEVILLSWQPYRAVGSPAQFLILATAGTTQGVDIVV